MTVVRVNGGEGPVCAEQYMAALLGRIEVGWTQFQDFGEGRWRGPVAGGGMSVSRLGSKTLIIAVSCAGDAIGSARNKRRNNW